MGRKSERLYDSSCFRRVHTGAHAFYEAGGHVREKRQLSFKKIIKEYEEQVFDVSGRME